MSLRRWAPTTLVMAAAAWALAVLGPDAAQVRRAVTAPQALVDRAGADALLVPVAAAAGWLCWGWGVLGLLLTLASMVPGRPGRAADLALAALLPAGARRLAAVAVGLTLSTAAPALSSSPPALGESSVVTTAAERPVDGHPTPAATPAAAGPALVADGPPVPAGGAPPDWPDAPVAAAPEGFPSGTDRVVLRGDCLWHIATEWLAAQRPGEPASDAEVLAAVSAWWLANATVIGPDPDLLLPGQVLSPPPA